MKRLSVKWFFVGLLLLAFLLQSIIFYGFFKDAEKAITHLLRDNLQSNVLVLKHFLEKNIRPNDINNIVTFLDNTAITSDIIKEIHVIDHHDKLLYATKRVWHPSTSRCINMAQISEANIQKADCYFFFVKLYRGFEPVFYKVYIYTDLDYINSLIANQKYKYAAYFFAFTTLFFLLFGYMLHLFLAGPLEKLRQFAYYSTKKPERFAIKELESIRYSLASTFSRLKKEQEELYKLSTEDALCGLNNKLSLMEKLHWLIARAQRDNSKFALIFLDLDNFKHINDSKGHDFGDEILQQVASLLLKTVRKNDFVARFGGDEFVIILPDFKDETTIVDITQRIQKQFRTLIKRVHLTASMGIAIYPKDGKDPSTLLKHADIAMYRAKELGKGKCHFFTESLNKRIEEHLHIQRVLKKALREKNLQLYYQPKVELETNRIVGCEALLRLVDPQTGPVDTQKLIMVAEKSGLIKEIGEWVTREAASRLQAWKGTPMENLKISLNASSVQFHDRTFLEYLETLTQRYDIRSRLDIELTESLFVSDLESLIEYFERIKAMGITLSLDDFGTGYSSLSYLKQIPFDTLKIDRMFIKDMHLKQNRSFVEMIIDISKILELKVVAEGVETEEQLTQLKAMGCDMYQGYFCSPPLPPDAFEAFFLQWNT